MMTQPTKPLTAQTIINIIKGYECDAFFGADLCHLKDTEYEDVADDILKLHKEEVEILETKNSILRKYLEDVLNTEHGFACREIAYEALNGNNK